jgi:hypothetical protein
VPVTLDSNPKRRPLNGGTRDDKFKSYINEFGNIIKDLFLNETVFLRDLSYNSIKDPFINLFKLNEVSN